MIDRKAYNSISYSISIVGSLQDGKYRGCVVNSLQQLTSSSPAKFAVTLNKYILRDRCSGGLPARHHQSVRL